MIDSQTERESDTDRRHPSPSPDSQWRLQTSLGSWTWSWTHTVSVSDTHTSHSHTDSVSETHSLTHSLTLWLSHDCVTDVSDWQTQWHWQWPQFSMTVCVSHWHTVTMWVTVSLCVDTLDRHSMAHTVTVADTQATGELDWVWAPGWTASQLWLGLGSGLVDGKVGSRCDVIRGAKSRTHTQTVTVWVSWHCVTRPRVDGATHVPLFLEEFLCATI